MNMHKRQILRIDCREVRSEVVSALTTFPQKIRGLREGMGLSIRDAAADMGFTPQLLQYYEKGKNFPSTPKLITIACYYGVSMDWLFGRDY